MASDHPRPENEAIWRALLTGEDPVLRRKRWLFRRLPLPSSTRCKSCLAPFTGPSAPLMRLAGIRPWSKTPRWCNVCDEFMRTHPGGAEMHTTLVFADMRGSTALAERVAPAEFRELMQRFYRIATRLFIRTDAFVDKLVGDEVVAIYLPAFAGPSCARRAIDASRELLAATGHRDAGGAWLPLGIGVNSGIAYVGTVGSTDEVVDFTALGDTVNVAARLAAEAGAGEVLVSEATCSEAGLAATGAGRRRLGLRGHERPVGVRVLRAEGVPEEATAAGG